MLKILHLCFITLAISGFIARFILLHIQPEYLERKLIKITPHIIDSLLLLSGAILIFQGQWFSGQFGWIIAKFILLFVYIKLGIMSFKHEGSQRYAAFIGAIISFACILVIAITKPGVI